MTIRRAGHALGREHLRLHRDAARRGEAADAAPGAEHPVARDHDGVRVPAQRLADRMAAPGEPAARATSPYVNVSPAGIVRTTSNTFRRNGGAGEIERHVGEVVGLAPQRRHHPVDRILDRRRRGALGGAVELVVQASAGVVGARLGNCTPSIVSPSQAIPQHPIGVSKSANSVMREARAGGDGPRPSPSARPGRACRSGSAASRRGTRPPPVPCSRRARGRIR